MCKVERIRVVTQETVKHLESDIKWEGSDTNNTFRHKLNEIKHRNTIPKHNINTKATAYPEKEHEEQINKKTTRRNKKYYCITRSIKRMTRVLESMLSVAQRIAQFRYQSVFNATGWTFYSFFLNWVEITTCIDFHSGNKLYIRFDIRVCVCLSNVLLFYFVLFLFVFWT